MFLFVCVFGRRVHAGMCLSMFGTKSESGRVMTARVNQVRGNRSGFARDSRRFLHDPVDRATEAFGDHIRCLVLGFLTVEGVRRQTLGRPSWYRVSAHGTIGGRSSRVAWPSSTSTTTLRGMAWRKVSAPPWTARGSSTIFEELRLRHIRGLKGSRQRACCADGPSRDMSPPVGVSSPEEVKWKDVLAEFYAYLAEPWIEHSRVE